MDQSLDSMIAEEEGGGRKVERRGRVAQREHRFSPYQNEGSGRHQAGVPLSDIAQAPPGERVLKVGQSSNVKTVAGSIAHVSREGDPPLVLALGASCLNTAVKACAIAAGYLAEDEVYVGLHPQWRDMARTSAALQVISLAGAPEWTDEDVELNVSARSEVGLVAGAIAGKVREGENVVLKAVGADSVTNAVYAIASAREYLRRDELDVCCVPVFDKEELASGEGGERSILRFQVYVSRGAMPAPVRHGGGRRTGGGGGGGGGGGRPRGLAQGQVRGGRPPPKSRREPAAATAADLDADLDEYKSGGARTRAPK